MENADHNDIELSLSGDEQAYGRLVKRYQGQVSKLMSRFSRDRGVCEELVQEVFVEAYFSLSQYRGDAAFMHWLSRIATRVGYRLWKKQKQEKQYVQLMDFDGLAKDDDSLEAAQACEILHRLLARLPRADRLVLTLMYFENCSTDEIARRMGWNRAMVKMRAYRARKKIKIIAEHEKLLEQLRWTH